ncbi:MAG: arginine decarboxylase, pyruvoyl-dependent [Deltaproteobacteria bacterium]|nr:arginine decarboxylase, pyruvoyl-dependent [Deltaproteobacteria bacterium]
MMYIPKEMFLTKGVGRHKEMLASFEEALRGGGIAHFNLVTVSSIFPPHCKIVAPNVGLEKLKPGQVVHVVMSRCQTDEHRRLIAASVGVARPKDPDQFGYLSEHHSYGETENEAGDYAEDLAASMLATVQGVEYDPALAWDEKKEIFKIDGKIVGTRNITQTALGQKGFWTTVIAAAVLIP